MTIYCRAPDCDRQLTPHSARGLCSGHYQQWKRGEDLRALEPRNVVIPWIEAHVGYQGDDCLIWPFFRNPRSGRGQVKWHGKMTYGYRIMCALVHGPAPNGKPEATHSCGKGHLGCINPRHLRWGSDKDNKADMIAHGTRPWGERQGSSKLTNDQVLAIRAAAGTASYGEIAKGFPVSAMAVGKIIRRERWRHI